MDLILIKQAMTFIQDGVIFKMNNTIILLGVGALALFALNKNNATVEEASSATVQNIGAGASSNTTQLNDSTVSSYVTNQQLHGVDNASIINNVISTIGASGINGTWINGQFVANPTPPPSPTIKTIPQILSVAGTPFQFTQYDYTTIQRALTVNSLTQPYMLRDQYGSDITRTLGDWVLYGGVQ